MNNRQKEVLQSQLNNEKKTLNDLKQIYKKALDDINNNIAALQGRTDTENLQSIIYQTDYQKALKKQVEGILDELNTKQFNSISEYLTNCYEDGFIGTMYDLQGQGVPLIFPIDQEQVVRALQTESKLSKSLYETLGEDVNLLKKRVSSNISRGIAQGSSYYEISKNIAAGMVGDYSKMRGGALSRAMTIARTEGHRISATSAYDAAVKSKEAGADVVKQWDAALDGRTRPEHAQLDGQIREIDEPFVSSNGHKAMYPGGFGIAALDINCRCAGLTRARWALDEDELQTLKDRAEYFGLDKTTDFDDFKKKYLKAAEVPQPKVKKEYLTEKKLKEKLAQADTDIADLYEEFKTKSGGWSYDEVIKDFKDLESFTDGDDLKALKSLKNKIDEIELQKIDWQNKLDKKLVTKEVKKLTKEKITLQDELDNFTIKKYSGIWKDDVTTADWIQKSGSIQAKKDYFNNKLLYATGDEAEKFKKLLKELDDFDANGSKYYKIETRVKKIDSEVAKLKKGKVIKADQFSDARKDAAYWFTDKNGSTKAADAVLRDKCGEVWRTSPPIQKNAIYEYTKSYHKFNEPLRGIEYGTSKYLGVGNVDLDQIGVKYSGYKPGQVKAEIDAMTAIIDKSSYDFDMWMNRGVDESGMDKFFGINPSDFYLSEKELADKLVDTTPTEYGFMSTGVSKGKGFSHKPIIMNVYAPKGTKMMYAEPFSRFGDGAGASWDGVSSQSSFGYESEMILQRGTQFRVTKVEKSGDTWYIDMDVIDQSY